ncbi:MAG TPA: DUF3108 domain-containing protein, partial [Balneolales bacterium]|nr:DUF3108 domain-containing protein [Balneolales bacterium]
MNQGYKFLILLLFPLCVFGQPFHIGEKMTFDLKYGFIKAGHSVMALEDTEQVHGHTTYRIHSRTSSTGFVDTFYSVRDRITSWVDTHTLATIQFEKSLHEGSYKKDYQVWFDYKNMLAYSNQDTLEIQTYMQDIL